MGGGAGYTTATYWFNPDTEELERRQEWDLPSTEEVIFFEADDRLFCTIAFEVTGWEFLGDVDTAQPWKPVTTGSFVMALKMKYWRRN